MSARGLLLGALGFVVVVTPALGQSRVKPDDGTLLQQQEQQQNAPTKPGEVAKSAVGRVGERQTQEQAAPYTHPMRRISNRIDNRIQSRIRNRIGPNYDPQANATSPFKVAEEKARTTTGSDR